MDGVKRFLIFSLIVFFAALVYSLVSFYQLRQFLHSENLQPKPEGVEESNIPVRPNPSVLKSDEIPQKASESDIETPDDEIGLIGDEWTWWDSEKIDILSTDTFTSTPETPVGVAAEDSKYPPVPTHYPFTPIWLRSEAERAQIPPEHLETQELLNMAMVKLWSEGDHSFTAGVIQNGIFYPLYPDVAYVEWDEYEEPDGTIYWSAGRVLTTGGNDSSAIMDQLNNGETPAGVRIVDYKSAGIDPYQLLSN